MIEVILDASQLESFEACPRKWYYSYLRNLEPKHSHRALSTGSWYHDVLACYYSSKEPEQAARMKAALAHGMDPVITSKWKMTKEDDLRFHIRRIFDYMNFHAAEDESTQVLAVEQGFSYLLYEDASRRYILEGKIDIIARRGNMGLIVQDHKTQSRKDNRYEINHQVLNYLNATKADYFEYNYIGLQDKLPPQGMRRTIFKPPEGMLKQWTLDIMPTFDAMYICMKHVAGQQVIWAEPKYTAELERHIMSLFHKRRYACDSSKYGLCQYHKLCQVEDNSRFMPAMLSHFVEKDERWRAWS